MNLMSSVVRGIRSEAVEDIRIAPVVSLRIQTQRLDSLDTRSACRNECFVYANPRGRKEEVENHKKYLHVWRIIKCSQCAWNSKQASRSRIHGEIEVAFIRLIIGLVSP
jgi:hypothetical protein